MLKIGFFADGPWAHKSLEKIIENDDFQIMYIVVRYDSVDKVLVEYAKRLGVPLFKHRNVNSCDFIQMIKEFDVDINVSMSFNQILKKEIREIAPLGFINCHAGALPFYRGRNILNWVLINGEKEFGVTVHYVDDGIDTGDIILQQMVEISPDDRYGDLLEKAYIACADTLYKALCQLKQGTAKRIPQKTIHSTGFYCSRRVMGDEYIDWSWDSERIYNFVRGIAIPGPGARTFFKGEEYIIDKVELINDMPCYIDKVGNIVDKSTSGIVVKTGSNAILVTRVLNADTKEACAMNGFYIGNRFFADKHICPPPQALMIGSGGHAKVLIDLLKQQDSEIVGITEYDNKKWGKNIYDIPVLGNDEIILSYEQDDISLVNGIGSIGDVNKRKQIYEYFVAKGYHFPRIVHISSVVSSLANLADGVQVLAGVVVNAGVNIGENSIINTNASIDHDVSIGSHVHIAPGVTISGGATIGDCTHIGTGATVIQGVHIGSNVLIGAGAVVVKDIPDNCKAYGVPAREV